MARRKKPSEDESTNENQQQGSDDSFGLPEIEYEPIRRDEPTSSAAEEPTQFQQSEPEPSYEEQPSSVYDREEIRQEESQEESNYTYSSYHREEESSIWPKVLGILFVIIIALGITWYFVIYQPKEKERIAAEETANAARAAELRAKQEEENRIRLQREAAERRRLDSLAAIPKEGSIEVLNERTGRYYVVISSALDRDLLMDYANKLKDDGVSSKIIPPFGKHKVSRIAISEGDSFDDAQAKANALKADYGDGVWVLKY
ncbi:MAG: hypothetical protein KF687_11885 [Cyclobacteriaceae bacterium]|nr:hypothetical protein [Cyclobacteriaceae bacterium]